MKRIVIISCFDYYEHRTKYIEEYFLSIGCEVVHIIANYAHSRKEYINKSRENVVLIHVPSYKKNLSLQRIVSHRIFAKKAFKQLQALKPDLIYCNIPPNSIVKWAMKYKGFNTCTKLVFDIFDLWPETMVRGENNFLFKIPFSFWANLRDKYINYADYIFTECNLYQKVLDKILDKNKTTTLYATQEKVNFELEIINSFDEIHLCYLGSVNNIIDIEQICRLIKEIKNCKPVILHIIGVGESMKNFVKEAKNSGADVIEYGIIYDNNRKYKIFSKCHFGLNIMKDDVCVGLTLKSLTYFEAGLPILNNIKADTQRLVDKYQAGFNIDQINIEQVIQGLEPIKYTQLRTNTKLLFTKELCKDRMLERLGECIKDFV